MFTLSCFQPCLSPRQEYISLITDANGIIKSRVYPGLWLDVAALLRGEMTQVLAILQQGLNSQEHQEFVQRLSEKS